MGAASSSDAAASSSLGAASGASSAGPAADLDVVRSATAVLESDDASVPPGTELKMVLCVVHDLGMSKGKIAAQVGHAVLGCWLAACAGPNAQWLAWARAWHFRAAAKITLKLDAADLDAVAAAAQEAGLPHIVIEDAGRTEIPAGSRTVVGIGPAPKELIDAVTGPKGRFQLKLLT